MVNQSHAKAIFWRALDQVMPDGPPVFLSWLIVTLLILNAIIAISRW
jgi:hypothetical protein